MPSAYSGGLSASDVTSHYKPENEAEAAQVRAMLREFTEDAEGLTWSTYEGLVRGKPHLGSGYLERMNNVGFFSKKEGLEHLEQLQAWWSTYEGPLGAAKVPNPHRQPTFTTVCTRLYALANNIQLPG